MPLERACAVGMARRPSPPPLSLPPWVGCWEHRPFAFSASLEPLIASAAVSIAANVHRAAGGEVVARRPLRLLDPCCGSGTVLAAGAALGLACRGSDLRDDFVCRARENLEFLGVAAEVSQHNALAPFPLLEDPPDVIIVSNPPWGKHIGGDEDGARILECVVREFSARSACCPREALAHPSRPPPLANIRPRRCVGLGMRLPSRRRRACPESNSCIIAASAALRRLCFACDVPTPTSGSDHTDQGRTGSRRGWARSFTATPTAASDTPRARPYGSSQGTDIAHWYNTCHAILARGCTKMHMNMHMNMHTWHMHMHMHMQHMCMHVHVFSALRRQNCLL